MTSPFYRRLPIPFVLLLISQVAFCHWQGPHGTIAFQPYTVDYSYESQWPEAKPDRPASQAMGLYLDSAIYFADTTSVKVWEVNRTFHLQSLENRQLQKWVDGSWRIANDGTGNTYYDYIGYNILPLFFRKTSYYLNLDIPRLTPGKYRFVCEDIHAYPAIFQVTAPFFVLPHAEYQK